MIKTVDLFFIFILQYFLLNIETNMNNLIGVLLIALSTFIVFGFKYFNDLYTAEKNVQINQKKDLILIVLTFGKTGF